MRPSSARDALVVRVESALGRFHPAPAVSPLGLRELLEHLDAPGTADHAAILDETALTEIEALVRRRQAGHHAGAPDCVHDGDLELGRAGYALCRALRPACVVETGVGNGVSTAFILAALVENRTGRLTSIDLPPPGVDPSSVGGLVPDELRSRWELLRGPSHRLLPGILAELGHVQMFLHDSRHTFRYVSRELRTVTPHLSRPAAVLVDDAERHSAFADWARRARPPVWGVLHSSAKRSLIGAAVFPPDAA